ncbi:MAG: rhodanese-like domain-containing protein [Syntrophorhabdales bacterium]
MKRAATRSTLITGVISLVTSWLKPAASRSAADESAVQVLEPKDALWRIRDNKENRQFVILDVRTADEFRGGHIGNAINIDYLERGFKESLNKFEREKAYLVYCRSGRRSGAAARTMRSLGFTNIYRMSGDMVRWQSMGLPLSR